MKIILRNVGFFIAMLMRPLHRLIVSRHSDYFKNLRKDLAQDPYLSGMLKRFNRLHDLIFQPSFTRVRVDHQEISRVKKISKEATLVYIMKNRGQLEYSFFNHRFLKEKIPLALFANGCRTLFWRPFREIIRFMIARVDHYYDQGLMEEPIESGYLEERVVEGKSVLLHLKISRELIFGAEEDEVAFIQPLLAAARRSSRPIYLVTQQFLYDRHPDRAQKTWVDLLFGEKANPGTFRKFILFLRSYRRRATVKIGEPFDLVQFIKANQGDDARDLARKLQNELLNRLSVEKKSITGPVLQSPDKFLEKILRTRAFKENLQALAASEGRTREQLEQRARQLFSEIAASMNYSYLDVYDHLVQWLTEHIYNGVDVDTEGLAKIKAHAGKHPIILVPSHKSHVDYLLISHLFYNYDLTMPHICAGINLKFWPVANLIRKAGGFFIRRSFGGDKLYKLVLETYVKTLVREGYCVEFFIEGGRSRTGKMLKPKMGILSMLMEGYLEGSTPDMYFVPISINYEQILEEKSYVNEMHGVQKEKENVTGLIKARRTFRKKYGKVFIRFGEPMSLKGYFDEKGIEPKSTHVTAQKRVVEEFAYRITHQINRISVITPTSLVAMPLLCAKTKGIPEETLVKQIHYLQHYLEFKGAELTPLIRQKGEWAYLEAAQRLAVSGAIKPYRDFEGKFYVIEPLRRLALDYHKNNALHFFVSLVCFSKILATARTTELMLTEVTRRYETIKTLLRHDFTFSERAQLKDHLKRIIDFYVTEGVLTFDEESRVIRFAAIERYEGFQFYAQLLDNFFESAYVCLLYLQHRALKDEDDKRLVVAIRESGKLFYLKGTLDYPEALSSFNIRNALSVLQDLGILHRNEKGTHLCTDEDLIQKWQAILTDLLRMTHGKADWGRMVPMVLPQLMTPQPLVPSESGGITESSITEEGKDLH